MKKLLAIVLCAILAFGVVGCGKKAADVKDEKQIEVKENKKADKKDKKDKKDAESNAEAPAIDNNKVEAKETEKVPAVSGEEGAAETPVIESAEELQSMVDEFNTTDDPAKKEELRKELEKILAQAEKAAATNE